MTIEQAQKEWLGKVVGHPACVLEPTRVCIRPAGHKGKHKWIKLPKQ